MTIDPVQPIRDVARIAGDCYACSVCGGLMSEEGMMESGHRDCAIQGLRDASIRFTHHGDQMVAALARLAQAVAMLGTWVRQRQEERRRRQLRG